MRAQNESYSKGGRAVEGEKRAESEGEGRRSKTGAIEMGALRVRGRGRTRWRASAAGRRAGSSLDPRRDAWEATAPSEQNRRNWPGASLPRLLPRTSACCCSAHPVRWCVSLSCIAVLTGAAQLPSAKESLEDLYERGPQVGRGAFGKVYKG